jgi:nucleoside-diphosphate-sugar epimerase
MSHANMTIGKSKRIYFAGRRGMVGLANVRARQQRGGDYKAHTTARQPHIRVGNGVDVTISELAYAIMEAVGYSDDIAFDTTKPDGTPHKLLDVSTPAGMGWQAHIELKTGLKQTYKDFLNGARA